MINKKIKNVKKETTGNSKDKTSSYLYSPFFYHTNISNKDPVLYFHIDHKIQT